MTTEDTIAVGSLVPLDADSAIPRYRQIADQLARVMQDRRPGLRLPSEHEIVRHFGVSRATATQALRDLEQRGLVYRRQGRGTFVADSDRAIRTNRTDSLPSFSEDLRAAGRTTRERVIALEEVAAPVEVAIALALADGARVWRIERVIVSDGEPVVHLSSWLPVALFPGIVPAAIEGGSLYEHLESLAGSRGRPSAADEHWSAASAPAHVVRHLELVRDVPVMRVVRTAYLPDGTAAEFVLSYVRGETFAVSMHIGSGSRAGRVLEPIDLGLV